MLAEDVFRENPSGSASRARKLSFSGFNMQEIADRTEMTRGNLYRYVDTKRELWFAILQDLDEKCCIEVEEIIEKHDGNFVDLIEKILLHYINFAAKDSHLMQKMIFLSSPPPKFKNGIPVKGPIEKEYSLLGDVLPQIYTFFEQGIKSGELKQMNPLFLMQYFWGIIQGFSIWNRNRIEFGLIMGSIGLIKQNKHNIANKRFIFTFF